MLNIGPNPTPTETSWKRQRQAIWLTFSVISILSFGAAVNAILWARKINWPDPSAYPIKNVANRVKAAGLPVTVKRLIYIDLDDNTYVFAGTIKPNSWLAKQVKPDGKFRELDLENQTDGSYANLALALHRPNEMPVFTISSSNRDQEMRDKMARNSE